MTSERDKAKNLLMDALIAGLTSSDLDYEIVQKYRLLGDPRAWVEVNGIKLTIGVEDRE